jgi:hypothetical protein
MIARQKDSGFGWKLEDFEFRAAFTIIQHFHFLSRERNSTGFNDCFVVVVLVVLVVVVGIFILWSFKSFCAFPWHISLKSLFVPCYGTFCAFPWHISLKSLFVPCYGTFCALPWHIIR